MREKRESKAVAVALKETSVAASTTTTLAGADCKPSGPCSGGCACEADKAAAVVAQKQQQGAAEEEQEEDVAATGAEEAVVDVERLQKELLDLTETLLAEEVLDQQFIQLQQLQDESNPQFVSEVVSLFFEDSGRLLEELTESL
jgi:hypothetical protein